MKRIQLIALFAFLSVSLLDAQIQTHSRTILYEPNNADKFEILKPNEPVEQEVDFEQTNYSVRRVLRVVGGIEMPGRFAPRGEEYFRQQESLIDENLDSINTYKDLYSLYFKGNNDLFERHVYNRITGEDFSGGNIDLQIAYKRKNLKVAKGGDFGIELQLYYKNERRYKDDVYDKADSTIFISIPQGTGNFNILKKNIKLPKKTVSILMRVGGTNFEGECWLEAPRISIGGKNVFTSPFIQNENRTDNYNYWVGINMATRSWPRWRLEFNDKVIFEGNVFDRASDIADFYIALPDNIKGKGKLKLTLLKEAHRRAFSYKLRSLQLIEESANDFEVVSVPRFVSVGDTSAILVEVNNPNVNLNISSQNLNIEIIDNSLYVKDTGLQAVQFVALWADVNIPVKFQDQKNTRDVSIEQFVVKDKDDVYISSGDEIYIDKEYAAYDPFFKWYMQNRVGNWYQFRPSYQWSGVRITDADIIKHYTNLLNKMRVPYAWQVEGRTLAAQRINPPASSLQSPMFRGKQAHENDGGYYYWQQFVYDGLHSDMAARTRPYGGIFAKHRPIYTSYGTFIHYDPYGVKDMADGANKFIANLSYSRGESSRHTGPSAMFRYFYQAGYDWLGAEQMYGPEEATISILRGASRAYGKKDYGSLHAVQWGSKPFTDPKHSLRFFMSLAVAYMQGSSHINTEEGLWTDEYDNDRYSKSGKEHLYAQHQMLDYIETHSRKGDLKSKVAVIQGRNDAWKSFGRTSIWSQKGDKWKFNKSMESFDLLKVFYPENNMDVCGTVGLFTHTPYGSADVLPIEAPQDVMNNYEALIFLGWNNFDNADFIRLQKYVEQGGTLLLTAAHLNSELQPDLDPTFPEDDTVIQKLLGLDYKTYKTKKTIKLGKGTIIYYPQNTYPADDSIREQYTEDMKDIAQRAASEEYIKGWIKSSPYIDFTVWDSDNLRTLYLLNVDWENEKYHSAKFVLDNKEFDVNVPLYKITTIRVKDSIAAMLENNTSVVLQIEKDGKKWVITCQTTAADKLTLFNGKTGKVEIKNIENAGIYKFTIAESV